MLNVTPDSFSDGGNFLSVSRAIEHAGQMIAAGADVIEVGGESTRPGANPVAGTEELARVIPVIGAIARRWPATRVAIDTVKSHIAEAAVAAGATIVNDVSALRLDPGIAAVAAKTGSTLILMHSRGDVASMATYKDVDYPDDDVVGAVVEELRAAAASAIAAGVDRTRIVVDPGLGFSKRPEQTVAALANLPKLLELGFEVMVGASRKRFIGGITGVQEPAERGAGTIGANVVALTLGATWFRVHDVRDNRRALDVAAAVLEART